MPGATPPPWHSSDQRWPGGLIFSYADPLCAESSPSLLPLKGQLLWKEGEGEGGNFHMIQQLVRWALCLYFANPSADHKGANFRVVLHRMQPAFRILSLGIWLPCWQEAGSTITTRGERMQPSTAAAIKVPMSVSPGWLWLNSIHKIPKVNFQLMCGPERLSNTSFCR